MQVRSHQFRITATRRGSTDATIIAVVACLALAAAGGFFYQKTAQTAVAQAEQRSDQAVQKTVKEVISDFDTLDVQLERESFKGAPEFHSHRELAESFEVAAVDTVKVATEPAGPVTSLEDQILAHIEFGEFTRAVELAKTATDAEEKSQLLGIVADASVEDW